MVSVNADMGEGDFLVGIGLDNYNYYICLRVNTIRLRGRINIK